MRQHLHHISLLVCIWAGFTIHHGQFSTVQPDVSALNVLYSSLNSPPQLKGWKSNGGDPCGQLWRGITCSSSTVTEIKLSGLRLNGSLGYLLANLASVSTLDVSNNNIGIGNQLPYGLPPNVQWLDISSNSFGGGLPYSISQMPSLRYLNLSQNRFSESLNDMFWNLSKLSTMDLSFNNFSSVLPQSFSKLSSLTTLYLQSNNFSGTVDVLVNLPLENVNLAKNNFTGPVPERLKQMKNVWNESNSSTLPPSSGHTASSSSSGHNSSNMIPSHKGHSKGQIPISNGAIAAIIIAGLVIGSVLAFFVIKVKSTFSSSGVKQDKNHPVTAVNEPEKDNRSPFFLMNKSANHSPSSMVPSQIYQHKLNEEEECSSSREYERNILNSNINAAAFFSVGDLQMATESFSIQNLVGEGSVGRVYRAKFDDGKVLAVRNITLHASANQGSRYFLDLVSRLNKLRHPNISELVGYCCQHGQNLLVYKFQKNGSLQDLLHSSSGCNKLLTWNNRIKIALGAARGLEYLHEVCSPSIIHKNLKSSNILLDEEFNSYLSDCGMNDLIHIAKRQGLQENSDFGYCAPETRMSGRYTCMSDVYSFGVLMLELLTGRKAHDSSRRRSEQFLVQWATPQLYDIDRLIDMVDPTIKGQISAKSLSRFADVIALCAQPEAGFRPPMSEVIQSLIRLVQRTNVGQRTDFRVELD